MSKQETLRQLPPSDCLEDIGRPHCHKWLPAPSCLDPASSAAPGYIKHPLAPSFSVKNHSIWRLCWRNKFRRDRDLLHHGRIVHHLAQVRTHRIYDNVSKIQVCPRTKTSKIIPENPNGLVTFCLIPQNYPKRNISFLIKRTMMNRKALGILCRFSDTGCWFSILVDPSNRWPLF